MKSKLLVICSSVALLHLFVGGMIFFGGCSSTEDIEDEMLPPGAYVPEQKNKKAEPPVAEPPETSFNTPAGPNGMFVDSGNPVPPPVPVVPPSPRAEGDVYIVKKGDSLWKIARMYGVSEKEVVAYNERVNPARLRVGQKIVIPPGGKAVKHMAATSKKTSKAVKKIALPSGGKHIVKKGDSFYKIAAMYRVKAHDIADLNGLDMNKSLRIGQTLLIPKGGKASVKKGAQKKVSVKKEEKKAVDNTPIESRKAEESAVPAVPTAPVAEPVVVDGAAPAAPAAPAVDGAAPAAPAVEGVASDAALPVPASNYSVTVSEDATLENIALRYSTTAAALRKANPGLPEGNIPAGTKILIVP